MSTSHQSPSISYDPENYPRPHIPLKSILSWKSLSLGNAFDTPSIQHSPSIRFVTSGRAAIAIALKHMGVDSSHNVLIPAYHCSSMVEPVIWAEAKPVFYQINKDTSINLDHIKKLVNSNTKAVMVTHYFGFPQQLTELKEFCLANNIKLIEDCAHTYFGESNGKPIGTTGDYGIASIMKFFPVYDGGCLVSPDQSIQKISLESCGKAFQIKAAINIIENALEYNRLGIPGKLVGLVLKIKDSLWNLIKSRQPADSNAYIGPGAADGGYEFESDWIYKKISLTSSITQKLVSNKDIIAKRRKNYLRMHEVFSSLTNATPLYPDLPNSVVPYVYPLLMEEPEQIFSTLKNQGVPIVRFGEFLWEGVDESVCPVSVDLSRRVFQFPCHQNLTDSELSWMIEKVIQAINK